MPHDEFALDESARRKVPMSLDSSQLSTVDALPVFGSRNRATLFGEVTWTHSGDDSTLHPAVGLPRHSSTTMPPKIHLVRHAQGEHNAAQDWDLRDAVLTPRGKEQCAALSASFPYHNDVDVVFASPLRRTIQTAALSFGPALARPEVAFVLWPRLQEVSDAACDVAVADTGDDVRQMLPELFAGGELSFDISKVDVSAVTKGWNSKTGYWAYEKEAISTRAADVRNRLFQRSEAQILLVTHGAIAHFLTEDWDVDDPMIGTAYSNCEHREFVFTSQSTADDAHLAETQESRTKRGAKEAETDPHVLDELTTVEEKAQDEDK